jgi:hypothetical protein
MLDIDTVKTIPEEMARRFQVVALEKWTNVLTVGMVNPKDETAIEILENKTQSKIMPIKVDVQKWAEAINHGYVEEDKNGHTD